MKARTCDVAPPFKLPQAENIRVNENTLNLYLLHMQDLLLLHFPTRSRTIVAGVSCTSKKGLSPCAVRILSSSAQKLLVSYTNVGQIEGVQRCPYHANSRSYLLWLEQADGLFCRSEDQVQLRR